MKLETSFLASLSFAVVLLLTIEVFTNGVKEMVGKTAASWHKSKCSLAFSPLAKKNKKGSISNIYFCVEVFVHIREF